MRVSYHGLEMASQKNVVVLSRKECYQDGGGVIAGGPIGLAIDAVSGAKNMDSADSWIAMVQGLPGQGMSRG